MDNREVNAPIPQRGDKSKPEGNVKMKDAMQQIRAIADTLKNEYKAQRVILFGSYATARAKRDSRALSRRKG